MQIKPELACQTKQTYFSQNIQNFPDDQMLFIACWAVNACITHYIWERNTAHGTPNQLHTALPGEDRIPVKIVLQSHADGAQVSGVGYYSTVRRILSQVHRARDGGSDIC